MAASPSSLEEDLTCSVCCDVFREPVLLACGHSFCQKCLKSSWSCKTGRLCPLCRRPSPQEPLLNISLRSTCESFLQQQQQQQRDADEAQKRKKEEEEEEEERARLCPEHGQKLAFFCETEEQPVCSQCKKNGHRGHRVLSMQKALKERKAKLSTAMTPLKKKLDLLKNGTIIGCSNIKDIKSQIQDTERKMKKEFEEVYKFLRDEEAARLRALRQEAESCSNARKEKIGEDIFNLSRKLKDLEEEMEAKDAIRFMQNFNSILKGAQTSESALPEFSGSPTPASLNINVAKHVGNLKFRVWEKMKGIAPYYPVTLDPNAPLCFLTLSDDLAGVSRVNNEFCLCPAPGSEGILDDSFHSWDIDVGNEDTEWMLGLTDKIFMHGLLPVCPEIGFWTIEKKGGRYQALTTFASQTGLHLTRKPRVVRVQLWRPENQPTRSVRFLDAQTGTEIFWYDSVPCQVPVYPLLFPTKMPAVLKLMPAEVTVTVEEEASFMQKHANTFTTSATTRTTSATTRTTSATTRTTSATTRTTSAATRTTSATTHTTSATTFISSIKNGFMVVFAAFFAFFLFCIGIKLDAHTH